MTSHKLFTYNNKKIGTLYDGVFSKTVKKSVHLMRILNAWGIEEGVVDELRPSSCETIVIKDVENDEMYTIPFGTFDAHGIRKNYSSPQVFLPLHWFSKIENGKQTKRRAPQTDTAVASG